MQLQQEPFMALHISRTWCSRTLFSGKSTTHIQDVTSEVNVLTEGQDFEDWLTWICGSSWELIQAIPHTNATWHMARNNMIGGINDGGEHPWGLLCIFREITN
tara:strand:+ start:216 stop:524 length:309 start_codon:yes stop_codon:yes gene_type:complete